MERLTERDWKNKCAGYMWNVHPVKDIDDLPYYKKLAGYEDAEEQGSLVWVIHGAWQVDKSVQKTMGKDNFVCSHCRTIWASSEIINMHYCPTCGAKMDLKESLEQALKEGVKNGYK